MTNKTAELKNILIAKLYSPSSPIEIPKSPYYEEQFEILKETFLSGQRIRVIKRFIQTSKLMKNLVNVVWSYICVFLDIEQEYKSENLLGLAKPSFPMKYEDIAFPPIPRHLIESQLALQNREELIP